jgi:putative acetyltransferase
MVTIREERPEDIPAIRRVNQQAFGQADEADIVDALRESCDDLLSLVALTEGRVVGHILFSPVQIEGEHGLLGGVGLAPMAVLQEYQRQGIGSRLVEEGLGRLRKTSCPFVIVIGHPEYYPRFGFVPASRYDVRCEWEVPAEAFQILPLDSSRLQGVSGVAKYRAEFGTAV